ncbi:MAG: flagellar hook protein FlgE [Syntrophales bacterium]|nr:flagellar hook protein FlgE [Syntrophales bacterium]
MGNSLYSGISGLNACERQMDIIGNNIANTNTIGFKSGKMYFSDILSQSMAGGMQIGRGVSVIDIETQFAPGSFETTSNATDLSINGDGFFIVKDQDNAQYYTRAGAFNIDADGYLVNLNGYRVQGLTGTVGAETMGDIPLRDAQSVPVATTGVSAGVNLDAETPEDGTFYVSQTIYDSLGARHTLNLEFIKTATAGEWSYHAYMDDVESDTTAAAPGTITFESDGTLDPDQLDVILNFNDFQANYLNTGAEIGDANDIVWVLAGDQISTVKPEAVTSYASTSVMRTLSQDGYASGVLTSVSVGQQGEIVGYFTNGQTSNLGYLALAEFSNPWGLSQMGANLYCTTTESGEGIINQAGTGGMGSIISNSLEMSNTDIATEFINMITAQRAYQANAKVVQTADTMMGDLMSIKR